MLRRMAVAIWDGRTSGVTGVGWHFLGNKTDTSHLCRANTLVQGFETPSSLELLPTVYWLITRDGAFSIDDESVYSLYGFFLNYTLVLLV
jgi:hypothetical protein